MKIFVKAKPGARKESVEKISENTFLVSVKEPPEKGRANQAILKALAAYFKIPVSNLTIVSGVTSRNKIIKISD